MSLDFHKRLKKRFSTNAIILQSIIRACEYDVWELTSIASHSPSTVLTMLIKESDIPILAVLSWPSVQADSNMTAIKTVGWRSRVHGLCLFEHFYQLLCSDQSISWADSTRLARDLRASAQRIRKVSQFCSLFISDRKLGRAVKNPAICHFLWNRLQLRRW